MNSGSSRYNLEEDYLEGQYDSASGTESETDDNISGGSTCYSRGGDRGSRKRRHQLELELFEFNLGSSSSSSSSNRTAKSLTLTMTAKPGVDFMILKAISILASPGDL
jgi:hypothetical protein